VKIENHLLIKLSSFWAMLSLDPLALDLPPPLLAEEGGLSDGVFGFAASSLREKPLFDLTSSCEGF